MVVTTYLTNSVVYHESCYEYELNDGKDINRVTGNSTNYVRVSNRVRESQIETYLTTFLRVATEMCGSPQTSCSRCAAVMRDSSGTGTIQAMPSLTAATCQDQCTDMHSSVTMKLHHNTAA